MEISLQKQISELKRELGFRKKLYPKWISTGSMRKDVAEYQISALEAAIKTLEEMKPPSGTQQTMF